MKTEHFVLTCKNKNEFVFFGYLEVVFLNVSANFMQEQMALKEEQSTMFWQ